MSPSTRSHSIKQASLAMPPMKLSCGCCGCRRGSGCTRVSAGTPPWAWGCGPSTLACSAPMYATCRDVPHCHLLRCPTLLAAVGCVVVLPWCLAGLRVCWRCCCLQARIQCARKLHSTHSLQCYSLCLVHDCVCFAGEHYVHRVLPERGPNWRAGVRSPRGAPVLACKGECHCY